MAQNTNWSPVLEGKVNKALAAVYGTEVLRLEKVEVDESTDKATEAKLTNNLFKVFAQDHFKGYAYVSQAPSMKNVFDYLVIFNKNLEIEKSKVLIYREQHGRQIGTVRWLSQFQGMNTSDRPSLGREIDGITGATISAKSMTTSIHDLLASLAVMKEKGVL